MNHSVYSALKKILVALLLLNTTIILIVLYLAFSNYSLQRKSLEEMGYTILRAFEASRPVIFSTGGNPHLAKLLNEMFDLETINNIVIYRQNGQIIFSLHPQNNIINTNINGRHSKETPSELILYNSFNPFVTNNSNNDVNIISNNKKYSDTTLNDSGFQSSKNQKRRYSGMLQKNNKIFIAIAISKDNLNIIRNYTLLTFAVAFLAELMIFFLYLRIRQVVQLYEQSLIKLKNSEKDAATGRLASILAHEIKNPLSSMSGLLSFAVKKCNDKQLNDIIGKTQYEVKRLSGIVNDFLTYGRSVELQLTDISLEKTIRKTIELLTHDVGSKNISIRITGDDFICKADENKIIQIFVNLILNAIDASPINEEITITLDKKASTVTIINKTIKLIKENEEKFFEPFFSTKTKGSGLGLSITKRLLEQHGYSIHIPSSSPFTVIITFTQNR